MVSDIKDTSSVGSAGLDALPLAESVSSALVACWAGSGGRCPLHARVPRAGGGLTLGCESQKLSLYKWTQAVGSGQPLGV